MPSSCWIVDLVADDGKRIIPREAFYLSLCWGEYDLKTVHTICAQVLDRDEAEIGLEIDACLEKWTRYLDWHSHPVEGSAPYPPEKFLYAPIPTALFIDGRLDSPAEASFILTHVCNFKCVYCFNSSSLERHDDLNTAEWLKIVDECVALDVVKCTISGGEPLMHPGFFAIVGKLLEHRILPYVCSNGSLIDGGVVNKLRDMALPCIQISLDAASAATHDTIAAVAPGTFPRVIAAIRALVAVGIEVYVKTVLTPINVAEAGQLLDLCHELGVKRMILDRFDLSNAGRGNANLFISREQELAVAALVASKQAEFGDTMVIAAVTMPRCWSTPEDMVYCGALSTALTILPNGSVSVCEKLIDVEAMIAGNLRNNSIEEIWNANKTHDILRPPIDKVEEPCKSCEHLAGCRTGCYAQTLFVSNNPYAADPRCWRANFADNPYRTHVTQGVQQHG